MSDSALKKLADLSDDATVREQVLALETKDAATVRRLHRDHGPDPQSVAFQLAVIVELCPLLTLSGVKSENQRKAVLEGAKAAFMASLSRLAFVAQKARDAQLKGWCEQAQICFSTMSGQEYTEPRSRTPQPPVVPSAPIVVPKKEPSITNDGHKWTVMNYEKQHNTGEPIKLPADALTLQSSVSICDCRDVVITIPADKLTAVILDKCDRVGVIVQGDVIASVEVVNSKRCQLQVLGHLPNVVLENSEGVAVHLSKQSRDVKIVSSRSSELNVLYPAMFKSNVSNVSNVSGACAVHATADTVIADTATTETVDNTDNTDTTDDNQHADSSDSSNECQCEHTTDDQDEVVEVAIPAQFVSYFNDQGHLITEPVQHSGN